jgi:type II secretory pathway pseudopilin PulG
MSDRRTPEGGVPTGRCRYNDVGTALPKTAAATDRTGEAGHTLVELLVAIILALVVFGAALTAYQVSVRGERETQARSQAVLDARTAMNRMVRELREGIAPVTLVGTTVILFQVPTTGGNQWVRYDCTGGSCRRAQAATQPPSANLVLVDDVVNTDVFTATADGRQVAIKLRIGAGDHAPAHLADGATLRNGG